MAIWISNADYEISHTNGIEDLDGFIDCIPHFTGFEPRAFAIKPQDAHYAEEFQEILRNNMYEVTKVETKFSIDEDGSGEGEIIAHVTCMDVESNHFEKIIKVYTKVTLTA